MARTPDEPSLPSQPSGNDGPREQERRATPRDVFEALLARFEVGIEHDRRRSKRYPWFTRITLWAREDWGAGIRTRELEALTCGFSLHGLSFHCEKFLRVGTPLSIRFDALLDEPILDGITRKSECLGGAFHCVGIEFVD